LGENSIIVFDPFLVFVSKGDRIKLMSSIQKYTVAADKVAITELTIIWELSLHGVARIPIDTGMQL